MKKVLATMVAVGLVATAANAATIGLRWAGEPGVQNHVGMTGTIEVYMTLNSDAQTENAGADTLSTVTFLFDTPATNLFVTGQTASPPGWNQAGTPGPLDVRQFGAFATVGNSITGGVGVGAGEFVVGTVTLLVAPPADGSVKDIFALIEQDPAGVLDINGAAMVWDRRYNDLGDPSQYANNIAFAEPQFGNPGWGSAMAGQQTAVPLQITKIPEPTSLALVALGGFALLRRRS
jgi:hypothetical protein